MTSSNAGDNLMYSDVDGINGPETTGIILLNQGDDIPFIDAGLAFGVVPVEWLSFEGEHRGNYNDLNWITGSEINTSQFEVELTLGNTVDFVEIGKVVAARISSETKDYEMRDYGVEEKGVY